MIEFEGITIETLIKQFKREENFKDIRTIEEIKNRFIDYLSRNTDHTGINDYLKPIINNFKRDLYLKIDESSFEHVMNNHERKEIQDFLKEYENFSNEFHEFIPDGFEKDHYNQRIWEIFSYELYFEGTGIVFAGFDYGNYHPSFFEINIHCNDDGKIIYEDIESGVNSTEPLIRVYAMNEEAYAFITGVNYEFIDFINDYVEKSNEKIYKNLKYSLKQEKIEKIDEILYICRELLFNKYSDLNQRIEDFRETTLQYTAHSFEKLPRNVICDFASALIQITALKQETSLYIQSVSKESEVALITKVNNFEWVKKNKQIL